MTGPADPPRDEGEDAALAADHALGVLDGEGLARAERRLDADPAYARAVAEWRERLAELDATARPLPASPALWRRIAAGIEADARPPARSAVADPAGRPSPRGPLRGLWESVTLWRAVGLSASAAALALAILAARPQPGPALVAVLMTDDNRAAALVTVAADGRASLVPLESVAVPDGRALQVWTLWDRERGPVSVGLTERARGLSLDVGKLPPARPDQLFEITLEPRQGSPTGRPTGPILMKGLAHTAL